MRNARRLAHHLDVVDQRDEHENADEHADRGGEEAHAEIERQRARAQAGQGDVTQQGGGDHVVPHAVANRRARRSVTEETARTRKAGGSITAACAIANSPNTAAANTARYWNVSAIGCRMPNTMLAKPMRRSVATPPTTETSDHVRLCRVVRGAPRYAKATIM